MSAASELEPLDTRRPFSRQQALAAGISDGALGSRAYQRVFTGVYLVAGLRVTPSLRAAAALVPFGPHAYASHASAARLLALPTPVLPDEHVTVRHEKDRRPRPGIACHVTPDAAVVTVDGVRCSSPEQAFVEVASAAPELATPAQIVPGNDVERRRQREGGHASPAPH